MFIRKWQKAESNQTSTNIGKQKWKQYINKRDTCNVWRGKDRYTQKGMCKHWQGGMETAKHMTHILKWDSQGWSLGSMYTYIEHGYVYTQHIHIFSFFEHELHFTQCLCVNIKGLKSMQTLRHKSCQVAKLADLKACSQAYILEWRNTCSHKSW